MSVQTPKAFMKKIPAVPEPPWIGSLVPHTKDRLAFYQHIVQTYGDVSRFHLGPLLFILFRTPSAIQQILVEHDKDFSKGELLKKTISPFSGNGLFLSQGEFHRRQRKLIAPEFQPKTIRKYADAMVQYSEQIAQSWQPGTVIDISQQMTALTLSIVGKVLFNIDVFDETNELSQALTINIEHAAYMMSSPFAPPFHWPTPRNRRVRVSLAVIRNRLQRMIEERRVQPQAQEQELLHDTLSILLQAQDEDGTKMTDQQVMDECQTLFGAGHETTATSLAWTWYLLARHPHIYHKVQAEVDEALAGRSPTIADLPRLPYCLQVFKEALRLYPPAYIILREALRPVEIDGYAIPRKASVVIPTYVLHRDPHVFPDPDQFDPDRFLPEREKKLPRNAYIPFGTGPRICIGNHFALMEGQLVIATLAQRVTFDLAATETIEPDPTKSVTLRPKKDIMARVSRRGR